MKLTSLQTAKIVLGNTHAKTPIQLEPLLTDRAMGMLEGRPWVADQSLVALINGVESDEAYVSDVRFPIVIMTHKYNDG